MLFFVVRSFELVLCFFFFSVPAFLFVSLCSFTIYTPFSSHRVVFSRLMSELVTPVRMASQARVNNCVGQANHKYFFAICRVHSIDLGVCFVSRIVQGVWLRSQGM